MFKPVALSVCILLAMSSAISSLAVEVTSTGLLVQALPKTGGSKIGELGRENETHVEIFDIQTGQATVFPKTDLIRLNKEVTDDFAAQTIGIDAVIAWKISRLIPAEKPTGTIASVDGATYYISLGSRNRIARGDRLRVFRGETIIKDPTTDEILGKQRRRISDLEVFESQEKFCKAKQLGELEIPLAVGDLVEPANFSNAIAIFPPLTSSNTVTEAGVRIAEDLTTALVKRGIPIVERKLLLTTLTELAIEQTALFDETTAAKVGKQTGAYGVLTGTLTSDGRNVRGNLRLIEVESGRVRFTVSSRLKDDLAKLVVPSGDKSIGTVLPRPAPLEASSIEVRRPGEAGSPGAGPVEGARGGWHVARTLEGSTSDVYSADISPDGSMAVSGGADQNLRFWDIQSGTLIREIHRPGSEVAHTRFLKDGKRVICTVGRHRRTELWRIGEAAPELMFENDPNTEVWGAAMSPDEEMVATAGSSGVVTLWKTSSGAPIRKANHGVGGPITSVAFSSNGTEIACAGAAVAICAVKDGSRIRQFDGPLAKVQDIKFSPSGDRIATAEGDGVLGLWNKASGKRVFQLKLGSEGLQNVSFSRDGRLVAASSNKGIVTVWNVASRARVATLDAHHGVIAGVGFGPDANSLITWGHDKSIKVWRNGRRSD